VRVSGLAAGAQVGGMVIVMDMLLGMGVQDGYRRRLVVLVLVSLEGAVVVMVVV